MYGFDRGLHETVSGAIMHFLNASMYAGQPDLMRQALRGHDVREPESGSRTPVPVAPARVPQPIPAVVPAREEPEPIAA